MYLEPSPRGAVNKTKNIRVAGDLWCLDAHATSLLQSYSS